MSWIASMIIAAGIKALIFLPAIPEMIKEFNTLIHSKEIVFVSLVSWGLLTIITKIVIFDNMKTLSEINEASARVDNHLQDGGNAENE